MAKHLGAKVYTTTSAKNSDYVKSLGADEIIDYNSEDYESVLQQLTAGVDLVLTLLTTELLKRPLTYKRRGPSPT